MGAIFPFSLDGGEAETGKGPVNPFSAERVHVIFVHPGQEQAGMGVPAVRNNISPESGAPRLHPG